LLNALKSLGGIHDDMLLLSPIVIEPIRYLKRDYLRMQNSRLRTEEILIALSISAATNPMAELALNQLDKLDGCEAHSSIILPKADDNVFQKLGVNITSEPKYHTNRLYNP
jgi:uncharacterized protein (UPF0371 family)